FGVLGLWVTIYRWGFSPRAVRLGKRGLAVGSLAVCVSFASGWLRLGLMQHHFRVGAMVLLAG
ncbi:MAG TPA: hypothetical protein DCX79_18710, partial [Planctomycetaceae bacterium]|nr:hypothetical protein [Planctomycetaceae bacterium]